MYDTLKPNNFKDIQIQNRFLSENILPLHLKKKEF